MGFKDSNIIYIGEIPSDWQVVKFKRIAKSGMGETILKERLEEVGFPVYSATEGDHIFGYLASPSTILNRGDLIIPARGNSIGHVKLVTNPCTSTQTTIYSKIKGINSKFLYYQAIGLKEWWFEYDNTAIPQITVNQVQNNPLLLPSDIVQNEVVKKLDYHVDKINQLIINQEQQIEKLKEYKQSLISEVVTKGLDPNVEFKESGIEWIGKIPAHWKMVFLSSIFYEHKLKNANLVNTNLLSLSYGNIVNKDINTRDGLLPDSFEGYNIVSNNDIVLRLTDLQNDKKSLRVGLCTQEGIITSAYITIRAKVDLNSYYFHKLLHSYDINKVFYGMGSGVRQSMGFNEIRKIPLLLPPKNEMKILSERVQETVCKIDALIKLKESKLEKLIDYKKSLIYEYVTGKKEVS